MIPEDQLGLLRKVYTVDGQQVYTLSTVPQYQAQGQYPTKSPPSYPNTGYVIDQDGQIVSIPETIEPIQVGLILMWCGSTDTMVVL